MIRTLKEWRKYTFDRGTTGEMVSDILDDWEEQIKQIDNLVKTTIATIELECKRLNEKEDNHGFL